MTLTAAATRSAPTLPRPSTPLCARRSGYAAAQRDESRCAPTATAGVTGPATPSGCERPLLGSRARRWPRRHRRAAARQPPEAAWVDVAGMHLGAAGLSLTSPARRRHTPTCSTTPTCACSYGAQPRRPRARSASRVSEARARDRYRRRRAGRHRARRTLAAPGFDLEDAAAAVLPDDRVTLMYTSGTTGAPRASSTPIARCSPRSLASTVRCRDGLAARGRVHPVCARRAAGDGPLPLAAARVDDDVLPRPHGATVGDRRRATDRAVRSACDLARARGGRARRDGG